MNKSMAVVSNVMIGLLLVIPVTGSSAIKLFECDYLDNSDQGRIKFSLSQTKVFHATKTLKFGFNQELGRTAGANGNFSHTAFNKLTGMLRPDALRYPGGTPANFFSWKNEKLDENAVDKYANKHIKKLLKKIKRENKGDIATVAMLPFLNLSDRYEFTPFIVLNMFGEDQEIISAIEKVKAVSKSVAYWELGNEVAYKHYHKKIEMQDGEQWSYELYAQRIKNISQYIKKRYPNDKIGVVASEIAEWRNPESVSTWRAESYRKKWDAGILSAMSNVDAIIFHPYVLAQQKQIKQLDMNCTGKSALDLELKTLAWMLSNISNLPDLYVKRANERFPGKEIWLTEFGIMGNQSGSIEDKIKRQNGLRVLSMGALYLSWLQKYPKVKAILTHGLFDGYNWSHIVYPDSSLTANGVAYVLIKDFLNNVEDIAPLKITGAGISYQGIDRYADKTLKAIYGVIGRNSVSGVYSLVLVNISNHTLELELPWKAYSKVENSFQWKEEVKPGDYNKSNTIDVVKISAKVVNVLPRSITIFRSK